MCTAGNGIEAANEFADEFEKLLVLSGVRRFPVRVKCATLAWHTLNAAITGGREVSTEA
jgi:nitrogen fixation NifU-like protein